MRFQGLTASQVEDSRKKYGTNALTQLPPDPLWKKIAAGFKDPMILILLVALAVQVVLFFLGQAEWFEPAGIFVAILIANGVSSISEYKQENKASALKEEEESKERAKVIRSGKLREIHVSEVVVGDVVYLQAGDKIPADGIIAQGSLKVDQAALNGETEEAEKIPCPEGASYDTKDLLNKYYAYRGTVVCGGEGYMEVKVTGDRTLFGELALEVQEETRETPLQVKLRKLAQQISTFGYVGAIAIIAGILLRTVLTGGAPGDIYSWIRLIMDAVTVAVTIIVCAVPEGLPMLTSILLSFQSLKMAKDNVLVRKINGLETAGSLNILFSDKTGTITEGRLSVVEMATGNVNTFTELSEINPVLAADLITGIGINNSAVASEGSIIGGNSTDRALMSFLVNSKSVNALDKEDVRNFNAFDSAKKYSSVTVLRDGESVTYVKGAPEKIIEKCSHYIDEKGRVKELVERNYLTSYIDSQAGRSMRLLAVAKSVSRKNTAESEEPCEQKATGFEELCKPEAAESEALCKTKAPESEEPCEQKATGFKELCKTKVSESEEPCEQKATGFEELCKPEAAESEVLCKTKVSVSEEPCETKAPESEELCKTKTPGSEKSFETNAIKGDIGGKDVCHGPAYADRFTDINSDPEGAAGNKSAESGANSVLSEESQDSDLILICVISIRDNVRPEAVDAIREVQSAGVQVVMVTGDRKETAVAIAKEAGLLTGSGQVALTSGEMAEKTDQELKEILPQLRVVSRALPTDKSRLVRLAQELDYVVGMTGDGVNDSPALKKADVGFAMGSGTEVAKEAGDITILDDNFSSIEKAILYGRTMFKSIRKFLIFQLTVNVAAVLICFIGPMLGENVVLTVIQLLLINLVMDTLAAIAFGSEPPLSEYMKEKPVARKAGIISRDMLVEILITALYITFICLAILFLPPVNALFGGLDAVGLRSALFATFMMAITFNGFNARTSHINVFENLGRNRNFILIMAGILVLQFVFVTFGGAVLSVESLSVKSWLICLALAFLVVPIDMLRKLVTINTRPRSR